MARISSQPIKASGRDSAKLYDWVSHFSVRDLFVHSQPSAHNWSYKPHPVSLMHFTTTLPTTRRGPAGKHYTALAGMFVSLTMLTVTPVCCAVITTVASGVYDENVNQSNVVDASFTGTPTSGVATVIGVSVFSTNVAEAFQLGRGGVINFDDVASGNSGQIEASYAGGASTLTITGGNTGQINTTAADLNTVRATAISGSIFLRAAASPQTYIFSTGLLELGFTVLARNTTRSFSTTLTYSDGSTAVFPTYTVNATGAPGQPDATSSPDTVFGFRAPDGLSITSFRLSGGSAGQPPHRRHRIHRRDRARRSFTDGAGASHDDGCRRRTYLMDGAGRGPLRHGRIEI